MRSNLQAAADRRESPRFAVNAPLIVRIGEREISGFTKDLSNRGIYFYMDLADSALLGENFEFMVEFPPEIALSPSCFMRCEGCVVRMDKPQQQLTGIAARILHYSIERKAASRSRQKRL
ncbi:MAG: PilZ domain-containing protein [Terracidiphilus sp.]